MRVQILKRSFVYLLSSELINLSQTWYVKLCHWMRQEQATPSLQQFLCHPKWKQLPVTARFNATSVVYFNLIHMCLLGTDSWCASKLMHLCVYSMLVYAFGVFFVLIFLLWLSRAKLSSRKQIKNILIYVVFFSFMYCILYTFLSVLCSA